VGESTVYGVHFEDSIDAFNLVTPPDPRNGPAPLSHEDVLSPATPAERVIATEAGLIFGVSLEAEPTCATEAEAIAGNESFGYGEVTMSTEVKPGRYFLSFGASGNSTGSGNSRGIKEVRHDLESPRLPVTFESWSVVYE
jgi:hypothetical protein